MNKFVKSGIIAVIVAGLIYVSGIGFYAEKFSANSKFYNVDISNLTLVEAQEKINNRLDALEFEVIENEETIGVVRLGDLSPTYDFQSQLESNYISQNPNEWVTHFFQNSHFESDSKLSLDEAKIMSELEAIGVDNDKRQPVQEAEVAYSDKKGYYLVDGKEGTTIDFSLIADEITKGIDEGNYVINLENTYQQPLNKSDEGHAQEILDTIDTITSVEITYELAGDTITIPQKKIEEWIYFDAANDVVVDEEGVYEYLAELNDKYSTFNKVRKFESTWQGTVDVQPGILGWGIDIETEVANVVSDIKHNQNSTRVPALNSVGINAGQEDEIGGTYVEIDLTNQYMFLYVDHELILSTPIVSGKIGAETVPGAGAVIEMLTKTKLVGFNPFYEVDYETPVDYWIRFDDKDQGIHDASWQWAYGGDIWMYGGSLGCINTPINAVSIIYQNVDYGTPVIVF